MIAVPGSRSASESTIFTVTVADAAGNKQNKTVVAGESAQFDDLVPALIQSVLKEKNLTLAPCTELQKFLLLQEKLLLLQ